MMKYYTLYILVLTLLCSCNNEGSKIESKENIDLKKEIERLTTVEKQKEYLEEIRILDQKVRTNETSALQKYGHDSKEHKESWERIIETDEINLQKIEFYLNQYDHPSIKRHGRKAAGSPWIVIHHASNVTGARRRNFNYLYKAWKNNDLERGQFTFYLNRLYSNENRGIRLQLKNPYTEEFEIDTLLEVLNLKDSLLLE